MCQHLDAICSDMSVFHRIDDIYELDGPTFWRLAWRLPHYRGAFRDIVQKLAQEEQPTQSGAQRQQQPAAQSPRILQGTATALQSHSEFRPAGEFGSIFEVTQVGAAT